MLLTFFEWLKNKKGVTSEALGRLAQMTHEELPDSSPLDGDVVVIMDKPKAVVTNDDIYYVLYRNDDEIALVPKAVKLAIDSGRGNVNLGQRMRIPRAMWKEFALINHLLTRKEKIDKFANRRVWIMGATKDRWIANRTADMQRQSKRVGLGVQAPTDFDPIKLAQVRQQLTGGGREEEPEVAAARNWLRGG